ncbi:MAG: hypothetical protein MI799_01235 [Desulfobacterales bacterium]|nr:hypothetical protein [Desulfobacterales bacterium]
MYYSPKRNEIILPYQGSVGIWLIILIGLAVFISLCGLAAAIAGQIVIAFSAVSFAAVIILLGLGLFKAGKLGPVFSLCFTAPGHFELLQDGIPILDGKAEPKDIIVLETQFLGGPMQSKYLWVVFFCSEILREWRYVRMVDPGTGPVPAAEIASRVSQAEAESIAQSLRLSLTQERASRSDLEK